MGGGGDKCQTSGYRYYSGLHLIFCHKVDEVQEIVVGEKVAWTGSVTGNSSFTINKPELFGGEDREGGVVGPVDLEFGLSTQMQNPYLTGILGGMVPAYRGLFGMIARKIYLAANNPYIKPWAVRAKRVSTGWQPLLQEVQGGMNAAHIIRECMTDTTYGGLGYPESDLDEQSFLNCANVLEAEGFGLNLVWSKNSSIEDFIRYVLDHIDGATFFSHVTGLYTMKLIRNDYDVGSLIVLNESNILELEEYIGPTAMEGANQVTVTYEDVEGREAAVTVQDPAGIERMNGQVNSTTYSFTGINNEALAIRVASRELTQLCTPLATCTLKVNRTASNLQPGDPFNFTWAPLGIVDMAMRVMEVEVGLHTEGALRIKAVRDVFSAAPVSLTAPSSTQWVNPINPPANSLYRRVEEVLWWDFVRTFGTSDAVLAELTDQTSLATCFCARPSSDSINFEMWSRVQGALDFTRRDTDSFPEVLTTITPMVREVTSVVELSGMPDIYLVKEGDYAYVGNELTSVTLIDGNFVTLTRGILDTLPENHPAGTLISFPSALYGLDSEERAAGETVEVRMLPSTSEGRLSLSDGITKSLLCTGRMMRPYPPGNVKINTLRWPTSIGLLAELAVSWSHRSRILQTVSFNKQDEGDIGPEAGVTYTLRIYGEGGALLRTITGLTVTAYTYPADTEKTDSGFVPARLNTALRIELESVRNGLISRNKWNLSVARI